MNGPNFQTLTGGSFFQGSGDSYHTGIPASFYQTTGYSAGVGIHSYNGPGYAQYVAMPLASFAATLSFYGIGSVWAHMGRSRGMTRAREEITMCAQTPAPCHIKGPFTPHRCLKNSLLTRLLVYHAAGYLVFLANPFFGVIGVSYQAGDGGVLWAGPGAGTIGA